ncbi:MAG: PAS domain-containing protein, partial [Bdellovibrionales bacterium]|nr:PAS domain-containing protein [Bdellovibrionales bacterium]
MSKSELDIERPFDFSELFFSTTDSNGKIICGNEVFSRISGFSPSELKNRPHSIIRHRDMPRVVFRLLWKEILTGRNIAAYVKNRAKDGSYYWVLAYVSPISEGFLSVRFKPSSPTLQVVSSLYRELRELELSIENQKGGTKDAAIEASGELLIQRLRELGFDDYDSFITNATIEEFTARTSALMAANSKCSNPSPMNSAKRTDLTRISETLSQAIGKDSDIAELKRGIS